MTNIAVYPINKHMKTLSKTYKFIGKVLSDGHLSIPDEIAGEADKEFEVTMTPVDEIKKIITLYLQGRIEKKGALKDITKNLNLDPAKIEEAIKEAFGTTDVDVIMNAIRR